MTVSALSIALAVPGCMGMVFGLYLLIVSIAAAFYSPERSTMSPETPVVVLVPAHDEEALIARCVRSLCAQTYPDDLYKVVVIADNCTDDTAAAAAAAGAHVMTRHAPTSRGKGQALRWALDRIFAWESPPKAVVIVDADSIAGPDLVAALVRRFETGVGAVQGMYLLSNERTTEVSLSAIAFMLVNRIRPAGLAALHLPGMNLTGNGMLLSRDILERIPWTAYSSTEDLEYSLMLYLAGETIAFAGDAMLSAPAAPNPQAAGAQRLRWHGGRLRLARTWAVRLIAPAIAEARPSLLAVALALMVPPLGLLTAAVLMGSTTAALFVVIGLAHFWAMVPWLIALGAIPASVLAGLRAAKAPASHYTAMLRAPMYIFRTASRARSVLRFKADTWIRTERETGHAEQL